MVRSVFLLVFLFPFFVFAQYKIDFADCKKAENVDFNSLYPYLVLKHEIGSFYKLPKNPVLSPTRFNWDSEDTADPFVFVTADSISLFYDGSNDVQYSIGYAVRDREGWGWQKRKQILKPDEKIQWRSFHLVAPTIIPGKNTLVYNGNHKDSELGYWIGLAGQHKNSWFFYSDKPVMQVNEKAWDFAGNAYQDVVYMPQKKIYKMWYSGFSGPLSSIGLAESDDGLGWIKTGDNPVFGVPPGVIAPDVIYNGEKYIMFYTQLDLQKGIKTFLNEAESEDGQHWQFVQNVLKPEARWEGQRLMRPNISYFEEQYHLFYCAQQGSHWQIGEAQADAVFADWGEWQSNIIEKQAKTIIVDFEQPANTSFAIEVFIKDSNIPIVLNLEPDKKTLRNNVFRSRFNFEKMTTVHFIKIKMSTIIRTKSPVVYSISLFQ